jgi:macrolide transport system ATP-binding/permease protein
MRRLRELILRFGGLFNKQRKDRELEEEIESHLQMHIEDNLRLGMSAEEARRQAMIKLGGIESTKRHTETNGACLCWRRYGGTFVTARGN